MSDEYRAKSKNIILVKDDVGKAKPTCFNLPPESHAYGRCEQVDLEGAREVTMSWMAHAPSKAPPYNINFAKVNKMAAKEGITDAKGIMDFRRSTDMSLLLEKGSRGAPPKVIPSDVIPSFTYGRKSRPSTPIASVIAARYAAEHEELLSSSYSRYASERPDPNGKHKIRMNKTYSLRMNSARGSRAAEMTADERPELFKLSKFKNVAAKLVLPGSPRDPSVLASAVAPVMASMGEFDFA